MNATSHYQAIIEAHREQARAQRELQEKTDAFVLKRLHNLQAVGRSVTNKVTSNGSVLSQSDALYSLDWVFRTIVRYEVTPSSIKLFLTPHGLPKAGVLDEVTIARNLIHLSDRAFASYVRKTIRSRREALQEKERGAQRQLLKQLRAEAAEQAREIARLEKLVEVK